MADGKKPNPSLLSQFTTWAGSSQPSIYLPLTGVGIAALLHAANRNNIVEEERNKELLRSMLLGGLAGTGAELARLGIAGAVHRVGDNNQINRNDIAAVIKPEGQRAITGGGNILGNVNSYLPWSRN